VFCLLGYITTESIDGQQTCRRNTSPPSFLLPASCWFIFRPWRWRRLFPPKHRVTNNGLQVIISQAIELDMSTAVRNSNRSSPCSQNLAEYVSQEGISFVCKSGDPGLKPWHGYSLSRYDFRGFFNPELCLQFPCILFRIQYSLIILPSHAQQLSASLNKQITNKV
jgi:hypothetical protein